MSEPQTREFHILVENRFGVLFNITGLFCARGYNIETLFVRPDRQSGLSRITMTVRCSPALAEQIVKQLNKIMDVIEVNFTTTTSQTEESWQTSTTSTTAQAV